MMNVASAALHTPIVAAAPVARASESASTTEPATSATLPLEASRDAGSTGHLGGMKFHFDMKKALMYGLAGAAIGMLVPVIPGGPIGGAAIGALLSALL